MTDNENAESSSTPLEEESISPVHQSNTEAKEKHESQDALSTSPASQKDFQDRILKRGDLARIVGRYVDTHNMPLPSVVSNG